MGKRYTSPITSTLTPDNWRDKLIPENLTVDDMVNVLGDARQMEKLGKVLAGYIKEILGARLEEDEYENDYWELERKHMDGRASVDKDKLKEDFGDEWLEGYMKTGDGFDQFNMKRKEE